MLHRYRHVQLFVTLSLLLLLNPFIQTVAGGYLIDLMLVITLGSAILACARRRRELAIGIVLSALMTASMLQRRFAEIYLVDVTYSVLGVVFFFYVTFLILSDVFRDSVGVSADTICGALAGYLLIGVGWAFAYALLDQLIPGSITGLRANDGVRRYDGYLGYSFVTLTTLGYGNVVPGNAKADALAVAEAIVGQIYLTVLVARLVALNLVSSRLQLEGKDDPKQV